jgi:hypothetical protein
MVSLVADDPEFKSAGDPFSSTGSSGNEHDAPEPERFPVAPPAPMPKLWIGYLFALVTFISEMIAISRHPEIVNAKELTFTVPPLEIFLPVFVARAYWFVCIYRYHKILAAIPRYVHPISPAKAVGFHFIPFFNIYWIFAWPSAIADFVNARLGVRLMKGWVLGAGLIAASLCQLLLDAGLGIALLFLATSYVSGFLSRALSIPQQAQQ